MLAVVTGAAPCVAGWSHQLLLPHREFLPFLLLSLVSGLRSGASAFIAPRSHGSCPRAWETSNNNATYVELIICQILL